MQVKTVDFYHDIESHLSCLEIKFNELECGSFVELFSTIIDAYSAKSLHQDVKRCCLLAIRSELLEEKKYNTFFSSLIALHDYELVISIWRDLDTKLKNNLDILSHVARAHYDQNKFESCIELCTDILDTDESRTVPFSLLLSSLIRSDCGERIEEFLSIYESARVDKWFMYLYYDYCRTHQVSANKVKNTILKLGGCFLSDDRVVLTNGLRLSGNISEAIICGSEFIKIYSNNPWLMLEYGHSLLEVKNWFEYEDVYKSILLEDFETSIKSTFRIALKKIALLRDFYENNKVVSKDFSDITSIFEYVFSTIKNSFYEPNDNVALVGATMGGGGAECVLANVHLELQRQRYPSELWLYSINSQLGYDFFIKALDIEVSDDAACYVLEGAVALEVPFSLLPGNVLGGVANNCQRVFNFIKARRPKAIHAWQDDTNLEVAFAAIVAGVPKIILHPHNMRPEYVHNTTLSGSFKRAYQILLTRSEVHFVCVSQSSLDDYLDWLEIDTCDRFHVIYNGFDFSRFVKLMDFQTEKSIIRHELGLGETETVIGGCFRFVKVKRPLLWVQVAIAILNIEPDYKFVIFGDGPELLAAQDMVNLSGLAQNIVFCGQVEQAALKSIAFDVFLHTSESEGLPTVLIEAQANGVPVVASDVGGTSETLVSNFSQLVDTDEVSHYVAKIFECLELKNNWKLKVQAAQATRIKFSVEKNTDRLRRLYD
jgi:glycosyltransferase involved in cell wall biosynthesis